MKQVPIILSLLATSLMGSSLTNSTEEKPTGGVTIGEPSEKFSEFRVDFEASRRWKEEALDRSSSPLSHPSSTPVGRSGFYDEVLKVGTRHQYAANLSEQEEIEKVLKMSRREAEIEEETRKALEESEALVFDNIKKQEIAELEDQIALLDVVEQSQREHESILSASLINAIDKKYGRGDTDTDESRATASIEYDKVDKELNESRDQNTSTWFKLRLLRRNLQELQYGISFENSLPSFDQLPLGIGGPSGLVTNGLPPIHSSALVTSSGTPTVNSTDNNNTGDKF